MTGGTSTPSVRLLAAGDVCLRSRVPGNPLTVLKALGSKDRVVFLNLETALSNRTEGVAAKAVPLHTSPDRAEWLRDVGVDIVSVANNHVMDAGPDGFSDTLKALDHVGIAATGGGDSDHPDAGAVVERGGFRTGFLGYSASPFQSSSHPAVVNGLDSDTIAAETTALRQRTDAVVVSIHAGVEDSAYPSPELMAICRRAVNAGAAAVLAHHPHVIQGIERHGQGLIAYSLGNFQFFGEADAWRESIALDMELSAQGVERCDIIPIIIGKGDVPERAEGRPAERILQCVEARSVPIRDNRITEGWWYAHIARPYLAGNLRAWRERIKRYGAREVWLMTKWLVCPFVLRCYLGLLRPGVRKHD